MPCSSLLIRHQLNVGPYLKMSLIKPTLSFKNPKKLIKNPLFLTPIQTSLFHSSAISCFPSHRVKSVIVSSSCSSSRSLDFELERNQNGPVSSRRYTPFPSFQQLQQNFSYGRYAYDDYSEEESDHDVQASSSSQKGASTLDNIEEWKWKFTMLVRNKDEQELVSKDKKDRRDFAHLEALATRMGLYSRQYSRVVVFSKVPIPNYRSDLDDKRPQREWNGFLFE